MRLARALPYGGPFLPGPRDRQYELHAAVRGAVTRLAQLRVYIPIRHSLILLAVSAIVVLAPLAQATPPDQTWISGLYDNADYDDVVLSITSAVGIVDSCVDRETGPVRPVGAIITLIDERPFLSTELSSNPTRAPPAA